jgi:hypothetical protein
MRLNIHLILKTIQVDFFNVNIMQGNSLNSCYHNYTLTMKIGFASHNSCKYMGKRMIACLNTNSSVLDMVLSI